MDDTAHRAIAVVGLGAILPDAPDGRRLLAEPQRRPLQHQRRPAGALGSGALLRPRSGRSRQDLLEDRRLGARGAVGSGRLEAAHPAAGRATRWTTGRSGPSPAPARRSSTTAARARRSTPSAPRSSSATPWPGEKHYLTTLRIQFPEFADELARAPSFGALPSAVARGRPARGARWRRRTASPRSPRTRCRASSANCIAGRIANLFNFHGPNYVVDAACASALAAISAAAEGLIEGDYDAVVTGGIDRNMGASSFAKFCKIGALSATGTRPYADGADGFVMGEGAAVFVLKRLADAERAGDRIYAVLRGLGGSSDGKGKGITAPNPVGQRLAVERAWRNAGLDPGDGDLVEGHGTSTRVGDVVEVESLGRGVRRRGRRAGHDRARLRQVEHRAPEGRRRRRRSPEDGPRAAPQGAAAEPQLRAAQPEHRLRASPFRVNTELRPWDVPRRRRPPRRRQRLRLRRDQLPRRARGVRAGPPRRCEPSQPRRERRGARGPRRRGGAASPRCAGRSSSARRPWRRSPSASAPSPPRRARVGHPPPRRPRRRISAARAGGDRLRRRRRAGRRARRRPWKALASDAAGAWKALRAQGIFRGRGPAPKVAFLYTGQGSQYVNMLKTLRAAEPIVAETFAHADRVMTPLLGRPLTDYLFVARGRRRRSRGPRRSSGRRRSRSPRCWRPTWRSPGCSRRTASCPTW